MSSPSEQTPAATPAAPASRDELITMVGRAHHDTGYGDSTAAGRALAARSRLPKLVAENLGAGFGQWNFFPEANDVVDFALAYVPPASAEDVWALARTWAADDAAGRHTLLALVGREILIHELRRVPVPELRALFDESRSSRMRELRASLGLDVASAPVKSTARAKPAAADGAAPTKAAPAASPPREIPTRMPKPEFKPPPKAAAPPPIKKFRHPKFGEGVLEAQEGVGEEAKLTIRFSVGSKTLLAKYVTELPA